MTPAAAKPMLECPAMTKDSAQQVLEWMAIKEKRATAYRGMVVLVNAIGHSRELPSSEEDVAAIALMEMLEGPLEDENKSLSETECELWQTILKANELELTSLEIAREQWSVSEGESWIERTMRRLGKHADQDGPVRAALMTLADLRNELAQRRGELSNAQRDYQMARAESQALKAMGNAN